MKITEKQLRNMISESVKRALNEEIGTLDDLIMFAENYYDIYKNIELIASALLKKVKRGITPDRELLIDCSSMRKIQQMAVKIYSQKVDKMILTKEEKREFREYFADQILDMIDYWMKEEEEGELNEGKLKNLAKAGVLAAGLGLGTMGANAQTNNVNGLDNKPQTEVSDDYYKQADSFLTDMFADMIETYGENSLLALYDVMAYVNQLNNGYEANRKKIDSYYGKPCRKQFVSDGVKDYMVSILRGAHIKPSKENVEFFKEKGLYYGLSKDCGFILDKLENELSNKGYKL